jgi:phenylalanyl-tRNA synthetase beta chain
VYPKKIEDFSVFIHFNKVNKIIGEEIKPDTIKKILASLDIKVNSISEVGLGLTIPAYRVDVTREIDVIEEILRVYGYNNIQIPGKLNATVANAARTEEFNVQNTIATQLCALGFNEMMANSLTTPDYVALSEQLEAAHNVVMLNPLSNDLSAMRQSLLFSALEAVSFNCNRRRTDLKFFEFGKSYHNTTEGYIEEKHLTLTLSGNKNNESWLKAQEKSDFFLLKGYVMAVVSRLGLDQKVTSLPFSNDVFSEGMALAIGKEVIVEFGVVKKLIIKHFDIKQEVLYADFNWGKMQKYISNKIKYTDIPKYPEVRRDFALLVDENVQFEQIYTLAKQTEKSLLKEVNLFDVYQGANLPEGKKSYAVSFILQDHSKTLTDTQIDKIMSKLQGNFESQLGASLR